MGSVQRTDRPGAYSLVVWCPSGRVLSKALEPPPLPSWRMTRLYERLPVFWENGLDCGRSFMWLVFSPTNCFDVWQVRGRKTNGYPLSSNYLVPHFLNVNHTPTILVPAYSMRDPKSDFLFLSVQAQFFFHFYKITKLINLQFYISKTTWNFHAGVLLSYL